MNTASLEAPKITSPQRKDLEAHKRYLERVIRDAERGSRNVGELRKKEARLEKEAASLHRAAAKFDRDAEIKLAATLKQIERVHEAIREAESGAQDKTRADFFLIYNAQVLLSKLGQATYHELLDRIGAALAPYYRSFNDARHAARSAPAVSDLVTRLLADHRSNGNESTESILEAATEKLCKIDALLKGTEIWRYEGGGREVKAALEPNSAA